MLEQECSALHSKDRHINTRIGFIHIYIIKQDFFFYNKDNLSQGDLLAQSLEKRGCIYKFHSTDNLIILMIF